MNLRFDRPATELKSTELRLNFIQQFRAFFVSMYNDSPAPTSPIQKAFRDFTLLCVHR
nr:MAG TPA: hypothetical protein [Caudoviricetes sp.]